MEETISSLIQSHYFLPDFNAAIYAWPHPQRKHARSAKEKKLKRAKHAKLNFVRTERPRRPSNFSEIARNNTD